MGTVAMPEMRRYNYNRGFATGCVAAGGSIGILIPPSVVLIVYGLIAEQSIGRLFLAGFIPGILEAVFYIGVIYLLCLYNPQLGPPGNPVSLLQKIKALRATWPVIILFFLVIGGIYFGVFTPTEAGGIGAFGAFIISIIRRKLTLNVILSSLISTAKTTAFILLIIMGANIFGFFLTLTKLPNELAGLIAGLEMNRYIIMAGIMLMYVALGCVMEGLSIILLTVPILLPLLHEMGFDPIWFGIIIVRVVEIGLITPPLGINVFVIKGVVPDVPMYDIFKGILPFLVADLFHVALLVAFPKVALFLPNLMK
jgi:tripartite ATP-independent transporter DctM subunit